MSGLRVLIVDDDEMQLEIVERALSRDGFEVRGAIDLRTLAAKGPAFAPHIVLVDMNMPDTPSATAVAAARAAAPDARVVIYSAWEETRLRSLCHELGADGYLSKSEPVFEIGKRLTAIAEGGK